MFTLGINAAFHDCSACLVRDGVVVAAAEEERFTRVKHGKGPVPFTVWQLRWHAIAYCLSEAGIVMADVEHVAYAYDPWIQLGERGEGDIALPLEPSATRAGVPWEALGLAYVVNAPRQLAGGAPHHLRSLFQGLSPPPWQWHFVEHHRAHEASAFLAAPFDNCAVLVIDGRGEQACTSYGLWDGGSYTRLGQVDFPHSLGLLYEGATAHLGFLHSCDEYKVMALASFGRPTYANHLRECVRYLGGGCYEVTEPDWVRLAGPPRAPGSDLTRQHMDLACSAPSRPCRKLRQLARARQGAGLVPRTDGVRPTRTRGALDPRFTAGHVDAAKTQSAQGPRGFSPGCPGRAGGISGQLVRERCGVAFHAVCRQGA
jgi:carbamoyltransferase